MASLVDKLTASGGTESAEFLNDIVAQLWPNINIAGGRMVKEIVEPMFATMLPGPLASLHFVKIDLGNVPMRLSHIDVHKIDDTGIKLDMDLDWDGKCDIELDGKMIPKIGIEHVQLKGRLSVLLCPLTNIIPLIGAAQISFINPPTLKMDFTDAASIADCFLIEKAVRNVILNIIGSMAVLPNRFLVKLDPSNDYFKTYQHHLGVVRVTVEKATGISGPKKTGAKRLLQKIIKDVPDCYCKVTVGAEKDAWRTSTNKNEVDPNWNESHDFLIMDHDQAIVIDVQDEDLGGDDDIGIGATTVRQILLAGGKQELDLHHNGEATASKVTVHAEYHNLVADAASLNTSASAGQVCGLATILIASVRGIQGDRDQLGPSVKVSWGASEFQTVVKTYSPGTDIFNPSYDTTFQVPITADLLSNPANFKITFLNKTDVSGSVEIPFKDVLSAPGLQLEDNFDVGSGATVRAMICLRGTQAAQ